MKKIDFVIISSDENKIYKDFYPLVSKQWFKMGIKTYYLLISDENSIIENEYGVIQKIKKLDFVSTGFQSQVVRLYASTIINDSNILISDIDMMPINKDFFTEKLTNLTNENVILYSGQPYSDVPFYPMCYVLSNSNNLKEVLGIGDLSFFDFCKKLISEYGEKWNCDENFLYDKLQENKDKILLYTRHFSDRIDRGNWNYNIEKLKMGGYVDSHLLRPLESNYVEIKKLIDLINV
jgi:hypothetical protein